MLTKVLNPSGTGEDAEEPLQTQPPCKRQKGSGSQRVALQSLPLTEEQEDMGVYEPVSHRYHPRN